MGKIIPWIVLFMLSSPDAGNSQLQACLAVSQDGSSANSEKESATDGGDDEISVGDVVLKRTSLDGASMELWIPESFVAMGAEQLEKIFPPETGVIAVYSIPGENYPLLAVGVETVKMSQGDAMGMTVRFEMTEKQISRWLPVRKMIFESVQLNMGKSGPEPPDEKQLARICKRVLRKVKSAVRAKKKGSAKILLEEVREVQDRKWYYIDFLARSSNDNKIRSLLMGYYISAPEVSRAQQKVQIMQMSNNIRIIGMELMDHRFKNNAYPLQLSELKNLKEEYLVDPWGRRFHYAPPQKKGVLAEFSLYTLGKDGIPGGTGEDQDWGYCRGAVEKWPCSRGN